MAVKMLLSSPGLLNGIRKEHQELEHITKRHNIDIIISDNRYGAWHKDILSVIMTHQLRINTGGNKFLALFQPILQGMNRRFIRKFNRCWIPDYEEQPGLSGKLSHPLPRDIKADYIGPLSRFQQYGETKKSSAKTIDIVAMISGPEPQRSIFEKIILEQSIHIDRKMLILGGKPGEQETNSQTGIHEYKSHLESDELTHHLKNAELIISRPGYSTLMDLAYLQKKAVFVPTPGQTEQEYLAILHAEQGHCISFSQDEFNLHESIVAAKKLKGFEHAIQNTLLDHQVNKLLA